MVPKVLSFSLAQKLWVFTFLEFQLLVPNLVLLNFSINNFHLQKGYFCLSHHWVLTLSYPLKSLKIPLFKIRPKTPFLLQMILAIIRKRHLNICPFALVKYLTKKVHKIYLSHDFDKKRSKSPHVLNGRMDFLVTIIELLHFLNGT